MNFKTISSAVTNKIGRPLLITKKNSPALLFGAGVVGVVATVVLASRATLKLEEVLEETEKNLETARELQHPEYSEQDRQKDLVLVYTRAAIKVGKLYAPAVAIGAVSIAALTGSHVILNRRNVALTAAYAAVERGFREYRQRVADEYGEDTDRKFRYGSMTREIVEETEDGPVVTVVVNENGNSIYARFFDEHSTSWQKTPSYNQMFLRSQQNYANDLLKARGHVFLNEVYDMLGLSRSKEGAIVGWVINDDGGDNYIDFGVFKGNGSDYEAIRFINGDERSILLDFNVDGVIYDKI